KIKSFARMPACKEDTVPWLSPRPNPASLKLASPKLSFQRVQGGFLSWISSDLTTQPIRPRAKQSLGLSPTHKNEGRCEQVCCSGTPNSWRAWETDYCTPTR